mmetsp:Transcript_93982/g.214986  ORF Transcript_93982/g.214986 Transcript_93982/m.214986 type:complete len:377 (+) Transcript_93982:6680-7810(+)
MPDCPQLLVAQLPHYSTVGRGKPDFRPTVGQDVPQLEHRRKQGLAVGAPMDIQFNHPQGILRQAVPDVPIVLQIDIQHCIVDLIGHGVGDPLWEIRHSVTAVVARHQVKFGWVPAEVLSLLPLLRLGVLASQLSVGLGVRQQSLPNLTRVASFRWGGHRRRGLPLAHLVHVPLTCLLPTHRQWQRLLLQRCQRRPRRGKRRHEVVARHPSRPRQHHRLSLFLGLLQRAQLTRSGRFLQGRRGLPRVFYPLPVRLFLLFPPPQLLLPRFGIFFQPGLLCILDGCLELLLRAVVDSGGDARLGCFLSPGGVLKLCQLRSGCLDGCVVVGEDLQCLVKRLVQPSDSHLLGALASLLHSLPQLFLRCHSSRGEAGRPTLG